VEDSSVTYFLSCRVVKSYQLPSIFLKKWAVKTVEGKRSEMYNVKYTRGEMYKRLNVHQWILQEVGATGVTNFECTRRGV